MTTFRYRIRSCMIFTLGLLLCGMANARQVRPDMSKSRLAEVTVSSSADFSLIEKNGGIIDFVDGHIARVYLLPEDFATLQAQGFAVRWIRDEAKEAGEAFWERVNSGRQPFDDYHTNDQIQSMFANWQTQYPSLFHYESIGLTGQGRNIWAAKLSDNVSSDEAEIEVKYVANMHGDEVVGKENCLRFIDTLLKSYGVEPDLTDLMNNFEIWIVPLMNPDGNALSQRTNASGVDLNRNFPERTTDSLNTTVGKAPETAAIMNWSSQHNFVLSANFHGGALITNYPWDDNYTHTDWIYTATPEDSLFKFLSARYSIYNSPMYNSSNPSSPQGIINGTFWYVAERSMQDWNYTWAGDKDVTIEIGTNKWPNANQLETLWQNNRNSMKYYLLEAKRGIRGTVTDSVTGLPVHAKITAADNPYPTYSSSLWGDYYRILLPGTYTLTFSAQGYVTRTYAGLTVIGTTPAVRNVQLQPLPSNLEMAAAAVQDAGGNNNGSLDPGETDGLAVTIHNSGGSALSNIQLTLSARDTFITINTGTATIAFLGIDSSQVATFNVTARPSTPFRHIANFTLAMNAAGYQGGDQVALIIGGDYETFETGNFATYPWQQSGNLPWTIVNSGAQQGTYCAKSGAITHNQQSNMSVTLDVGTAGPISFYYKVSSESGYDYLRFYVDGALQSQWSGTAGWAQASCIVSTGAHTVLWQYLKDELVSSGSDCGWIDNIKFPPLAAPELVTDLTIITEGTGMRLNWSPAAFATGYKIYRSATLPVAVAAGNYLTTVSSVTYLDPVPSIPDSLHYFYAVTSTR
jgi:hypothetical protein